MRITADGQVTIPIAIRERAGLMPETEIDFEVEDGVVRIVPANPVGIDRGARLIAHLRQHRGDISMSTDEIMALMRGE
jgi:AbrB family looped-hinge helix DNA binding protein